MTFMLTAEAQSGGTRPRQLDLIAPTSLEHWALKRRLPGHVSTRCGVALRSWRRRRCIRGVVICGLAGSLVPDLLPGTVLVPEIARTESGSTLVCDPEFRSALIQAARFKGYVVDTRPLLTASRLITGREREHWAIRSFAAADMETALLANQRLRVATIRVVLDAPTHPISQGWVAPARALIHPGMLTELAWLAWNGPQFALRAADVLGGGLTDLTMVAEH